MNYWALKTTSGGDGKDHWPMFLTENVIAIGYADIKVNPATATRPALLAELQTHYPKLAPDHAFHMLRQFAQLSVGDVVLICRGYPPTQKQDVHIYGLATVTGKFRADPWKAAEWRFKHDADIDRLEINIPVGEVKTALGKGSLLKTLHDLDKSSIDQLKLKIQSHRAP